jgi:hypothetical protein
VIRTADEISRSVGESQPLPPVLPSRSLTEGADCAGVPAGAQPGQGRREWEAKQRGEQVGAVY